MSEDLKENLIGWSAFTTLGAVPGFGYWSLMYWGLSWPWWLALPITIAGGFVTAIFICMLPFIIWGIVGD